MTDFPPPSLALDATTLLSHSAWLAKFARALVANEADIDDVVQQTLATALARPPRHTGNLRGWLGTVAKNVVRSSARSDTARAAREVALPPPPPVESPVEAVARAELRRKVVECVLALDEPYRSTVILRFFEEQEVRAIARLTKTGEDTVRTRLRRGVLRVRELLERRVDEETRGTAHEGVAARALLLSRLRDIAASADRPSIAGDGGAHGSSAVSRGFGRTAVVQTTRRVLVGAAVVAAVGAGWWWWEGKADRTSNPSAEVAKQAPVANEPVRPETSPAVAVVDPDAAAHAVPPTPPPNRLASRFAARGTLRGVVTDPEGKPVAGARVWAILATSHEPETAMPEFGSMAWDMVDAVAKGQTKNDWVATDSRGDGTYEFTGLSKTPGWQIGAFEPAVGAMISDVVSFDHDHASFDVDVRLMRGATIHGTVSDDAGDLLGGAVVYLYSTVNGRVARTTWVTRNVEESLGEFDAGFRCGESLEAECVAMGYVPCPRQKVKFTPGSKDVNLEFSLKRRPGVVLRGRVVDPTGLPVDVRALLDARFTTTLSYARWMKLNVRALSSSGPAVGPAPGVAPPGSSEGRFDFVKNEYEIVVDENFHGRLELKIAKVLVGSVPLDLPARAPDLPCDASKIPTESSSTTFKVRFVDADTKQPIDLEHETSPPGGSDAKGVLARLRRDSDPPRGMLSYGCEPGFLKLEAEITGYALTIFILDVPRDPDPEPKILEVPRAIAGVRGIVSHADGRPFAKASISIFRVTPAALMNTGRIVVANPDGEFEFGALAKGDHVLVVSGLPDEAPVVVRFEAKDPFTEVEVRAAKGSKTRFQIQATPPATGPPAAPQFRILDHDGVALADLHRDWDRWADSRDEIAVPLQDGHYTVVARRDGFREKRIEFDVPAPNDVVEIALEPLAPPSK